jgi:hypothetical protein
MKALNLSTENDERSASLLMAVTFTLTGEFYDWVHATAQPDDRVKLMQRYPRPGELFMRVIGPWAIELVASRGPNINDRDIAQEFAKEFFTRAFSEPAQEKTGIGAEVGAPGVQQGPPPAPQTVTEDAVG